VEGLSDKVNRLSSTFNRADGMAELAASGLASSRGCLLECQEEMELLILVEAAVRRLLEALVRSNLEAIQAQVSEALSLVFQGEGLSFICSLDVKGRVPTVSFALKKEEVHYPLIGYHGGGVLDVISFVLRVLVCVKKGFKPIFILDESLPWLSGDKVPLASELIRGLCDELGLKVFLITQVPEFAQEATKVYRAEMKDGTLKVRLLRGADEGSSSARVSEEES